MGHRVYKRPISLHKLDGSAGDCQQKKRNMTVSTGVRPDPPVFSPKPLS